VVAPSLRIGMSTHSRAEVMSAAEAGADFVVFGPVFATPSKPNFVTGLAQLAQVVGLGIPVVALGGIEPKNARSCVIAGAVGVACIRSVMSATKISQTVSALLALLDGIET